MITIKGDRFWEPTCEEFYAEYEKVLAEKDAVIPEQSEGEGISYSADKPLDISDDRWKGRLI